MIITSLVSLIVWKMSDVKILFAEERDIPLVRDFVSEHFHGKEPAQSFHVRPEETVEPLPESYLKNCVEKQTLLIARKGEKLVGVLMAYGGSAADRENKKLTFRVLARKLAKFSVFGFMS
jgi:hypothetical protein